MLEKGFCRKNNYGTPAAYLHICKEKNYESEMTISAVKMRSKYTGELQVGHTIFLGKKQCL